MSQPASPDHLPAPPEPGATAPPPAAPARPRAKAAAVACLGVAALGGVCHLGLPHAHRALNTVSTEDAYVSGHVTAVAPRVAGQVAEVLVDDNHRVHKGDPLLRLDPEPYQAQVAAREAAVAVARADLSAAAAQVQAAVAQARCSQFKLVHATEAVNHQVAQLRAAVAALDSDLAHQELAHKDYKRVQDLRRTPGAVSAQDIDLKLQDYQVARAKVRQALENVALIRAELGLATPRVHTDHLTAAPKSLGETPADLSQTFSAVRQAGAEMMQAMAPLGVHHSSFDLKPKQFLEEFHGRDPEGNIDRIYAKLIEASPAVEQARAKVARAERDLDEAKLHLRYCEVRAEIDGVVTRRNVNPGNNLQVGQGVMAIRSLRDVWIDANFKETQLADLRIGQPVKVEVDMYGGREEFDGRITGFTMGTGQTLAVLPAQNATGNFVKIVQRLPVRIELTNYDPEERPLFAGLSVTPYVYVREPLVGDDPGKGKALQPHRSRGAGR